MLKLEESIHITVVDGWWCSACEISAAFGMPWEAEPRNEQWWIARHNEFVQNTSNNNGFIKVVFYGDSITQDWATDGRQTFDEHYKPLGTANYGIDADKTENKLWRIENGEATDRLNVVVCVVKIGTNNIDSDAESIANGVVFNVLDLQERRPDMKVLLLGILSRTGASVTERTSAVKNILKNLDNWNTIRFLDMKPHFYNGGDSFNRELYAPDILHLSAAGCRKWAEVMDPLFREMLSP